MRLYEAETKQLLADYGIATPDENGDEYVVKAQVLTQNRYEHGGVRFADSYADAESLAAEMHGASVNGHAVDDVLVEARVGHDAEYYVSVTYDTSVRAPVVSFGEDGGTGVEDRDTVIRPIRDGLGYEFRDLLAVTDVPSEDITTLARTLERLYRAFRGEDATLLEVNPLARTDEGYVALDGMMRLDDDASYRHERSFPDRSTFAREKTDRERRVEAIDKDDYRGVAGKYTELDGDIAMLLAGGGASLTNMDALIAAGGEPANYTEYGGNPSVEKVYELSKAVLGKPGLRGCWHVGGTANNTNVYRTMRGFCRALEAVEPDYPIVVRRDGPNADEGFELLRQTRDTLDLDMKLFRNDTSMTETASTLMEMVA